MWNASRVPAHAKLRGRRETRLLALLSLGEPLAAACRAVGVAPATVNRHRRADPAFAELVRAAREFGAPALIADPDWREIAAQLQAEDPARWAPPGDAFDAFDFDPGDPFDIDTGA
jgi:hypothetical protein